MARTYSADELLGMRDEASATNFDFKKLNPKVAADVLRVSEDVPLGRKRVKSLIFNNSDRVDSYSGIIRSRSEAVSAHSCSDDDKYSGHPSQQFPRQWRLQKRSNSGSSGQPSPAPSGIEAQKAENFKKFYEAVVSPTHVRVTAGGRIVPNFRALTQPVVIWNSKKMLFELVKQSIETEQQGPWLQGVSLTSTDPSSTATALQQPCGDDHGSFSDSQVINVRDNLAICDMVDSVSISENSSTGIAAFNPGQHIDTVNGAIKLSPPSQFDASRPFFFKGQLVYTVPPGLHPYSHMPVVSAGTLGTVNAYHQQHAVPNELARQNSLQFQAVDSQIPQQITLGGRQGYLMSAPFAHFSTHPRLHPVSQPADILSPASPAPLLGQAVTVFPYPATLRHQIYNIQQELKKIDDLLLNRHQINERYLVNQQSYLRNQLSELQAIQSTQTPQPIGQLYVEPRMSNLNDGYAVRSFLVPPSANSVESLEKSNFMEHRSSIAKDNENLAQKSATHGSETDGSLKMASVTSTVAVSLPLLNSSTPSESSSRQRLRAAAAMAPPFQPRSQLKIADQSSVIQRKTSHSAKAYQVERFPSETAVPTEAQRVTSVGNWMIPRVNSLSDPTTDSLRVNSFISSTEVHANNKSDNNGMRTAVPYLVGFPPSESPLEKADPRELAYSRKLTKEEIHARHLYWGKAPYEATKGLPKFDGRDFYPPSPVKTSPKSAMQARDLMITNTGSSEALASVSKSKSPKPEHSADDLRPLRISSNYNQPFNSNNGNKWASFDTVVNRSSFISDDDDDDIASMKSWDFTKAEENEIFSSTGSQISNSKQEPSSTSIRPANLKRPIARSATLGSSQSSVLQGMLKNSPGITMAAATGALSSATARGFLPQYGGSARASLSPSMNSFDLSSPLHSDLDNNGGQGFGASPRNENRAPSRLLPPPSNSSAVDFLQKLKHQNRVAPEHSLHSQYHRC